MREFIGKFAYPIIGAAIVLAVLLLVFRGRGSSVPVAKGLQAFYVDDETNEEVVLPANQMPPLTGKDGRPTLVLAHKFTNGGTTIITAYLEKYSDQALEDLQSMAADDPRKPELMDSGRLIRLPGPGQKWVPINSREGQKILNTPIPGDGPLQPVLPPK
ncbi:MAG: hypothetical protein FWD53_13400 [Phycisphaerales bacterium]|nr:hypothetical protein [Phycisphaerales bacterium]